MRKGMIWLLLAALLASGVFAARGEEAITGYDETALFAEEEDSNALPAGEGLEVFFFDLGRVDGILIRCEGVDSFIDVGFHKNAAPAIEYMDGLGVDHLDSYICSHAHADHIEGGPPIIKKYGADRIYMPHARCYTQLLEFASESQKAAIENAEHVIVCAGDSFQIGGATVYCYGPVSVRKCAPGAQTENDNSLILKLVYGERSILLTGDTYSGQLEKAMRKFPGKLKSDVFKNPHHNGTQDENVVRKIDPKITVFCTADENPPEREYVSFLRKLGSRVYITGSKHDGNIKLSSDGHSLLVTRGYPLTELTLNPIKKLYPTQKANLSGTIKPAKYADDIDWLCWTSSDKSVAKVSNGVVEAVGEGTATITVSSVNGLRATTEVEVYSCGVILNKSSMKMAVGDNAMLKYKIGPTHPEGVTAQWVSSDESVAFVTDEGEVIAVRSGKVKVGVQLSNGASAACSVTVTETEVERISLNNHRLKLSVGDTATLKARLHPSDATNKNVQWASSDESVATVDAFGTVTAVGKGKCTIGAKAASGKYDTCEVRVK